MLARVGVNLQEDKEGCPESLHNPGARGARVLPVGGECCHSPPLLHEMKPDHLVACHRCENWLTPSQLSAASPRV